MADDTISSALIELLSDPKRMGYALANGASNQADLARWAVGGMNGAPPAPYDGRMTPNQYVDLNFPRTQESPAQPANAALIRAKEMLGHGLISADQYNKLAQQYGQGG